jgi:hypothetical protein
MRRSEMTNFQQIRVRLLPERLLGFCRTSLPTNSRFAAAIGGWRLNVHPVAFDYPFLALIALEKPVVFQVLTYGYSTLWSVAYRYPQSTRMRDLPLCPCPALRPTPSLILGEARFARTTGRAPRPRSLMILQRGL